MAVDKFRFVSPGVETREIDRSARTEPREPIGPAIIGRAQKGPAMTPVKLRTREDLLRIFGEPVPGAGGGDVWREGSKTAPTYGMYAADAFLRNSAPLTYVRVLGEASTNATAEGAAGWNVENAHGLFYFNLSGDGSGSATWPAATTGSLSATGTGSLAAVIYATTGSVSVEVLSGSIQSAGTLIPSEVGASSGVFKIVITNAKGSTALTSSVSLDRDSDIYIRKVLNTNPEFTNSTYYGEADRLNYWLGETYESSVDDDLGGLTAFSNSSFAATTLLEVDGGTGEQEHMNRSYSANKASTGFLVPQDLDVFGAYDPAALTKLFRFVARNARGIYDIGNLKISITDIKASTNPLVNPYGTFSVLVRAGSDTDQIPNVLEQFNGVNLNPASENFIAARIGDKYKVWSDLDRRYVEYGEHNNRSDYIRLDAPRALYDGTLNSEFLPFGYFGRVKYSDYTIGWAAPTGTTTQGTYAAGTNYAAPATGTGPSTWQTPLGGPNGHLSGTLLFHASDVPVNNVCFSGSTNTISLKYPAAPLRADSTYIALRENAYFGVNSNGMYTNHDRGYIDFNRLLAKAAGTDPNVVVAGTSYSHIFSLDDVQQGSATPGFATSSLEVYYVSGSRLAGNSITNLGYYSAGGYNNVDSYRAVLEAGFNQFTMPMVGGFDGTNIVNPEPFANQFIEDDATETTSYTYYSLRKAIDTIRDPEVVEQNLTAIPGIVDPAITNLLIEMAENRRDTMAVIDIENDYQPRFELGSSPTNLSTAPNVSAAVSSLRDRQLNTSYAACFYPYVQIQDRSSGLRLYVPPSVAGIAAMGYTDAVAAPWFAPAGFVRGGLSSGLTGLTVLGASIGLRKRDRDSLYEQNINPIAQFPAEGVVIFGQKTLQATASALDRINVRRLLIFIKKEISRISSSILFEQNVEATWNSFRNEAVPFLDSVKAGLGLEDFRFILDSTTTTPDLVDRNILYARVLLKPARAIEFIALDFEIFGAGASFDD